MGFVVGHLDGAPPFGLVDGLLHLWGHLVGVHDATTSVVPRGPSNGLDHAGGGPQEAALVGIHDRHQDHLGQVQPFSQQIDPHEDIEVSFTQGAKNFQSFQSLHFGVQPPNPQVAAFEVPAQILGQAFREHGHDGSVAIAGDPSALFHQIFHLAPGRSNFNRGIKQAGGTNDLLHHHAIGLLQFPWAGGG